MVQHAPFSGPAVECKQEDGLSCSGLIGRHVTLPDDIAKRLAKDPNNNYVLMTEVSTIWAFAKDMCPGSQLLPARDLHRNPNLPPAVLQNEWRSIGVQQSRGWVHYAIHKPEPHIMLFRYSSPMAAAPSGLCFPDSPVHLLKCTGDQRTIKSMLQQCKRSSCSKASQRELQSCKDQIVGVFQNLWATDGEGLSCRPN